MSSGSSSAKASSRLWLEENAPERSSLGSDPIDLQQPLQFSVEGIQRFLRLVLQLGCDRAEALTQQQLLLLLIKRAEQRRAQITDEGQGLLGAAEPLKAANSTAAGCMRIPLGVCCG